MGEVTSYHLGFVFGPRMNAAGRLEHAARSLELVTTDNAERAAEIAAELGELNRQRQTDQAKILAEAMVQAETRLDDPVLVVASSDWSHGIVGIVASKLVERWRKPTLVMQTMGATTKGSARSLGSFNLVEALRAVEHNFIKFGGHHYAAGYTLETGNIDNLRQDINAYARELGLTGPLEVKAGFDIDLPHLGDVDWDLLAELAELEPFGNANPKPRFGVGNLKIADLRWVGQSKNHLKLSLVDNQGRQFNAISFDQLADHGEIKIGATIDAIFQVDRNDFNGTSSLQLLVQHFEETWGNDK